MTKTHTFIGLKGSQSTMEHNANVTVVKLLPSSFTNVITQCINPNFENNDSSWIAILYPFNSFTSNKPTLTWIGFQDSFKKFITRENVYRSPLNIQRSKLSKIVNANARFGNTCKSMVFLTIAKKHSTHMNNPRRKGNSRTLV